MRVISIRDAAMGGDPVLNEPFFFGLISTEVPYIERGHQAGLKTATEVFGGQVLVPLGQDVVLRDSAR